VLTGEVVTLPSLGLISFSRNESVFEFNYLLESIDGLDKEVKRVFIYKNNLQLFIISECSPSKEIVLNFIFPNLEYKVFIQKSMWEKNLDDFTNIM